MDGTRRNFGTRQRIILSFRVNFALTGVSMMLTNFLDMERLMKKYALPLALVSVITLQA
jgi:hypothetical protein